MSKILYASFLAAGVSAATGADESVRPSPVL